MRRSVRVLLALSAATAAGATALVVLPAAPREPTPDRDPAVDELATLTDGPVEVRRDPTSGRAGFIGTQPGQPLVLAARDPESAADEFVQRYGDLLGATGSELTATRATPRLNGGLAVRFQQSVDGIPVFGGEVSVQVDAHGGVQSSIADLSSSAVTAPRAVRYDGPTSAARAVAAVARAHELDPGSLTASDPEQWLYDPTIIGAPAPVGPRSTWRVEVENGDDSIRRLVLVDTATGTISLDLDLVGHAQNRQVCDFQGIPRADATCVSPDLSESSSPIPGATELNRAHDLLGVVHGFWLDRFGRDSYDGAGAAMRATVRFCSTAEPCPYRNAYWNGAQAVFGPGYAVDDVLAHELTHGLVAQTAQLYFNYQSGAINESMADVFGELIDQSHGDDDTAANRWLIGEALPHGPLRDVADPPAYGDPDRTSSTLYGAGPTDSGSVHTNSGVGNKAAALITDGGEFNGRHMRGLGTRDAAAVYYEALTALLTSGSDFRDLHGALPQACRNLIGTGGLTTDDCTEVEEAVDAVGMDEVPVNAPATDAPVCAEGTRPVDAFFDDFETPSAGNWTTDTAAGWYWSYPPPAALRYATSGDLNLWGPDTGQPHSAAGAHPFGDSRIALDESVALPGGSPTFLRFSHAYAFERTTQGNLDGGVVEYSIDDGATWSDLGSRFTDNGYSGSIGGPVSSTNPLRMRSAFVDESLGHITSRADLTDLGATDFRLRFRLGEDAAGGDLGWYVDDVRIYTCVPTGPAVEVDQAAAAPRVVVGDPIELAMTVRNVGTEPLTGLTLSAPEAPACSGPISDLAPGAWATIDCDRDTVAPDDVGTFVSNASVAATELPDAVAAAPVMVEVLPADHVEVAVVQATPQDVVEAGQDISLSVTVSNEGNAPLTGINLDTPQVSGCVGPLEDLAPGASHTVECTYVTADPEDIGVFTSTAGVVTTETPVATEALPVEVTVLAPDRAPPGVVVTSPVEGAVYNRGQVVTADYSCSDDSGWVDCDGIVEDGAPIDTSTPGVHSFTVRATDLAGRTEETFRTYTVAVRRPDGRIRIGAAGATVGDDRYNTTGVGQTQTTRATRRTVVTHYVTIENDGTHPEACRVRGQPSTANYQVRYLTGGVDISVKARTGTYLTPELDPGEIRTIKVLVTVGAQAPVGSQVSRLVTTTSTSDPQQVDVVRFVVKRR